jgi:putative transposase
MSWATFIKAHLGVIVGMHFFTVEVVTWLGLVRYHMRFAINVVSRKIEILGIAVNPGGPWMEQMARNLVDAIDGSLLGKRYLLLDRDPLCTEAFRRILDQGGVKTVRLPAHSPNLNAFAERFVLSIKSECLERLVPLGERHLRLAIAEYMRHYHLERNHQVLANALIYGSTQAVAGNGAVACRERLGGLLKFYHREAA